MVTGADCIELARRLEAAGRRLQRLELLCEWRTRLWTRSGRVLRGRAYARWVSAAKRRDRARRDLEALAAEMADLGMLAGLDRGRANDVATVAVLEAACGRAI